MKILRDSMVSIVALSLIISKKSYYSIIIFLGLLGQFMVVPNFKICICFSQWAPNPNSRTSSTKLYTAAGLKYSFNGSNQEDIVIAL